MVASEKGHEIKIFDKTTGAPESDLRLTALSRSSLDDPKEDHTVTWIQPSSAKENLYKDFLVQNKKPLNQLNV